MKKFVLAVTGLCCMSLAVAQSASDAATKERMERAKRDASNPLRIIIEASQVKRTRAGGDTAAPAAAPAPVATKAAPEPRAPAERRPARIAEPTPAPPTPIRTLAAPSPAAGDPPPTEATSAPPTASIETSATSAAPASLSAPAAPAAPDAAAPADVQAPAATGPAAVGIAAAAAAAPSAPNAAQPAAEVLAPLKLVRYIEPEIPARIRSRLRPSSEVTVAFKVQPDGSVSQAAIRATNARALDPVVLEAVRQWRYEPVPEEREHVVQLVFNLAD